MSRATWSAVLCCLALLVGGRSAWGKNAIGKDVRFQPGPVNGVLFTRGGERLAVYDWPLDGAFSQPGLAIDHVLLAHGRRDLAERVRPMVDRGTKATAPARERYALESPGRFWDAFTRSRFHDYGQQSTKILARPLKVNRWVKNGDTIEWQGLTFRVLETPGYTRGSVSYLTEVDGRRVAFTGDLIYGYGRILDLYSFQDAIPEAKIRGYHGYGSRLAGLVASIDKIAAERPDLIVPARGPLIDNPQAALAKLKSRVQALYKNYLSTNALHWYFKEERMRLCGERVLGRGAKIELMPYSNHQKTPDWIYENSTSRLIVSESGHAFLLDCGYQRVIDAVQGLLDKKVIKQVDGIFVTHYHDDHTDMVQAAAERFECPVYATAEYADVLEHPEAYHLPAMTANPVKKVEVVANGHRRKWHEFHLTFHFFPGQTYYHGALLAERKDEKPVFFIGDAFAPSGMDDYCVLNRNLVHSDSGYLLCLKKIRNQKRDVWLVNEHIQHVFSFSDKEFEFLERRYKERIEILRDLFPWDDPNYGIDEQWAVCYPYGLTVKSNATFEVQVRVQNHSLAQRGFAVTAKCPDGLKIKTDRAYVVVEPRRTGIAKFSFQATGKPGNFVITADVSSKDMVFSNWVEALVTVR